MLLPTVRRLFTSLSRFARKLYLLKFELMIIPSWSKYPPEILYLVLSSAPEKDIY